MRKSGYVLRLIRYDLLDSTRHCKQGKKLGKGGIDISPSYERSAPVPPPEYQHSPAEGRLRTLEKLSAHPEGSKFQKRTGNPAWRTKEESTALTVNHSGKPSDQLPRETGEDIGMGSPVPLSQEAVDVITRLRNQKVIIP